MLTKARNSQWPSNIDSMFMQFWWVSLDITDKDCLFSFLFSFSCLQIRYHKWRSKLYKNFPKTLHYVPLIYIYLTPPSQARCNTTSIFKQSTTGLNLEFSFSRRVALSRLKISNLPSYLLLVGGRTNGSMSSLKDISVKSMD